MPGIEDQETVGALRVLDHFRQHMSCVTCHVSHLICDMCHMSNREHLLASGSIRELEARQLERLGNSLPGDLPKVQRR